MTDPALTVDLEHAPEAENSNSTPAAGNGAGGSNSADADKLVPVSEAIRYRKRAQTAEQQLGELRDRFTQLQTQLDDSQQTISSLERRQKIDALLTESDAIDLDAARLLTEISVSHMDEPDVASAVEELRRQKPYLFRKRTGTIDSVMSAHVESASPEQVAAERAASTGDRRDLLDYLRLRRR